MRHGETERTGGLEIDDELELARLHHRQVRRLRTLEDAAGIDAELPLRSENVGSVAHQSAELRRIRATEMSRESRGASPGWPIARAG